MRVYEVFYCGKKAGLVASTAGNIANGSLQLVISQTKNKNDLFFGETIEADKITFSDENHEKYKHIITWVPK